MIKLPKKFPNFKNKKVLILGLGVLGRGVKDAIFFAEAGARVTVTDLKTENELKESMEKLKKYNIKYTLGRHDNQDILNADLIIRNAGVPPNSPFIKLAKKHKIPVEMDESLFAEYCPCPIIGITGTRGKSTTTALIGKMLEHLYRGTKKKIYVAGNIQGGATLPLIKKVKKDDLVVLELSSWQLQGFGDKKISPHIAIFTNIYPDHLNYYKSMPEYIKDKKYIFLFQSVSDWCVINRDNQYTKAMERQIRSKKIWFSAKDVPETWKIKLPGEHNRENIAAALVLGRALGFSDEQMKSPLINFTGLEHRLELVKIINNVHFLNDSTSTTPIAGAKALQSTKEPIILLAGGASKNLKLKIFAKEIVKRVKAVFLLEGSATDELESEIKKLGGERLIAGRINNFSEAMNQAWAISLPGDTILLSPGCASFGLFKNEFDRGDQFKKIVNSLK